MNRAELEALVRAAVDDALNAPRTARPAASLERSSIAECDDGCRPRNAPPPPAVDRSAIRELRASTPARIAQGRSGTRYLTHTYVGLRAEHAIARDAVFSEIEPGFPAKLGCLELWSRCQTKEEFLLFPDHGRRLRDDSRALLTAQGTAGADVQLIFADGLSSWAIARQGAALVPALLGAMKAKGFSVGVPLFVRFARIGVQDEIGVLTRARATVIAVGERPGLGTGDSLSLYMAYGPRLNQDNAEKNCISNIRPMGVPPAEAAARCADLMRKSFDAGGGGIHLVRGLDAFGRAKAKTP